MKRKTLTIILSVGAACITLMSIAAGIAIIKYPYTVRYVISLVSPSKKVKYSGSDIKYLNTFNDTQSIQIKAAKSVGLSYVPSTREDVMSLSDQLAAVKNCKAYSLAPMGHSVPYLRPNAKDALNEIGMAFRDSLRSKNLPDYKIVVTSILRTKEDVKKLQKTNSVAVSNSCHCYGTTFDISYNTFERVSMTKSMSLEDLKRVLGEVLYDQRKAGNIYVKYEISQPCFHITSRH